jgi:hypothetical protein
MPKYRLILSVAKRPYDFRFMTVPKFPLDTGDPVLFFLDGVLQVGRWFARIAGFDWIFQSDRAIRVVGTNHILIVGIIVPLETRSFLN